MTTLDRKIRDKLDWLDEDEVAPGLCVNWATAAIRAVLDLHQPWHEHAECGVCRLENGDFAAWPCPTVQAIAAALGITQGTPNA